MASRSSNMKFELKKLGKKASFFALCMVVGCCVMYLTFCAFVAFVFVVSAIIDVDTALYMLKDPCALITSVLGIIYVSIIIYAAVFV